MGIEPNCSVCLPDNLRSLFFFFFSFLLEEISPNQLIRLVRPSLPVLSKINTRYWENVVVQSATAPLSIRVRYFAFCNCLSICEAPQYFLQRQACSSKNGGHGCASELYDRSFPLFQFLPRPTPSAAHNLRCSRTIFYSSLRFQLLSHYASFTHFSLRFASQFDFYEKLCFKMQSCFPCWVNCRVKFSQQMIFLALLIVFACDLISFLLSKLFVQLAFGAVSFNFPQH